MFFQKLNYWASDDGESFVDKFCFKIGKSVKNENSSIS